jgi:TPR repeat protein
LPKDDAQAVIWFRKAAEAGDGSGMSALGDMYRDGRGGLPKDEAQAVTWYRKAAQLHDAHAQEALRLLGQAGPN